MARQMIRVQQNGQVTLPASVRRELNLKQGELITIAIAGSGILITPQKEVPAKQPGRSSKPLSDLLKQRASLHQQNEFVIPTITAEEVARRAAVIEDIIAGQKDRSSMAPLPTVDLVRLSRKGKGTSFDP